MKKILAWLLMAFPACTLAQGLVEVEVVNDPLIVDHPVILPSELRSSVQKLSAAASQSAQEMVSFNDLLVELKQVSWSPTNSPTTGVCQIIIRINDLIAFVGKWEPPVGIAGQWQPPVGIAGQWQPPGSIVFTPNDSVGLEVRSVNAKKNDKGACEADFVVLATNAIQITDGP